MRVEGQTVFNSTALILKATLGSLGLAYLAEDKAEPYIADGRLVRVLADWCAPFPGYHLYYPSRRQPTPAFAVLVEAPATAVEIFNPAACSVAVYAVS